MIGQTKLLSNLNLKKLPRFTIITGPRGQGKKTLANDIAYIYNYPITLVGIKIEDIRYMIETAYKQTEPIIYLIADADDMSINAKNSLLKIIEEPPQQAYFIMTLQQIENTLPTIKSRCYELIMDNYTNDEKEKMIKKIAPNCSMEEYQILNKLDNYWQIQTIMNYNPIKFYEFVLKVYNNIYKVQAANSFKFAEQLDLKNDGNGYDLELFFQIYVQCCMGDLWDYALTNNWKEDSDIINECINITYKYKNKLKIKGINKQMLLDNWILDIRKEWLKL